MDGLLAILQSVVRYVRAPPTGANAGVDIASTVSRYVEELRNRKKVKQLLFEGVERFNKSVDGKVEPALTFLQGMPLSCILCARSNLTLHRKWIIANSFEP